jgi:error-prone DNA polymerase
VIRQLGFAGFFLVMWDAVQWARGQNILCQGRGSAANSAVTYCLGVTSVDPVRHGLLFERFLSPARADGMTEAPDIDVDVEHDRRELLLDYVYRKYGRDHAAIACVAQTYSASTAVQDVCRAYGVPLAVAFALSKRLHYVDPAEGAAALRGADGKPGSPPSTASRPRGSTRPPRAATRCCRRWPPSRGCRACAPRTPAASCSRRWRSRRARPWSPPPWGARCCSTTRTTSTRSASPKFDFLGLGALGMVRRAFDAIEARTGGRPTLTACRRTTRRHTP